MVINMFGQVMIFMCTSWLILHYLSVLIIVTLNFYCCFGLWNRPHTLFHSFIYVHNSANVNNIIFIIFPHHFSCFYKYKIYWHHVGAA